MAEIRERLEYSERLTGRKEFTIGKRIYFLMAAVLPACMAAAQPPATQPGTRSVAASQGADAQAEVPWGKEVDGLVCRLIVPKDVLVGEPIPVTIEVKNVSGRKRYFVDLGRACNLNTASTNEYSKVNYGVLAIRDPKGAGKTGIAGSWPWAAVPEAFKPIEPGEIRRAVIDLHGLIAGFGLARVPGEYRLGFKFTSPKPEKVVTMNYMQFVQGKGLVTVNTYSNEPTKEQVAGAWVGAIEASAALRVGDLAPKNLTIHEWGVFSAFNDAKYANADLKAEWESMPTFFYRQFPTPHLKLELGGFVKKPIIYFHSDRPKLNVSVKVSFSQGAPVVWWPCASLLDNGGPGTTTSAPLGSLEWCGVLNHETTVSGPVKPVDLRVGLALPKGHEVAAGSTRTIEDTWLKQARIDGPAMFTVDAGFPHMGSAARRVFESERFLYYDGLAPAPDLIRSEDVTVDSVTVQNSAKFAIANLILVDCRDAKAVRFARVEKIEAGGKLKVALKEVPADWPAGIARTFGQDLRAAGLFDTEADSVLAIWKKGLFDRPGITAIYLLPQSEYDRMLPLTVFPPPGKVVRVGIVLHGQLELTPAILAARVRELLAAMDSDDYRLRDKATKALADLGPSAFPAIRKTLEGKLNPEVKTRLEKILEQDVANYLKPAPGPRK